MDKFKTMIVGATPNPARYAYMAAHELAHHGIEIVPIGIKKGQLAGVEILNIREKPLVAGIHTITLYIGPQNQPEWYDYLLDLHPHRIIFNPGAENDEFKQMAESRGIEAIYACTLVMLSIGNYRAALKD